jgi:hypothetical protein
VIAQRYDAKILTALLAVGDCIYFDLGTPECAWQRPSRSELPQCIGSRQSPVARIRTEALLALLCERSLFQHLSQRLPCR